MCGHQHTVRALTDTVSFTACLQRDTHPAAEVWRDRRIRSTQMLARLENSCKTGASLLENWLWEVDQTIAADVYCCNLENKNNLQSSFLLKIKTGLYAHRTVMWPVIMLSEWCALQEHIYEWSWPLSVCLSVRIFHRTGTEGIFINTIKI
jgi:hypothetical protein